MPHFTLTNIGHKRFLERTKAMMVLQDAPLYKLHADKEIGAYLYRLAPSAFRDGFNHICAVRLAVNRQALEHAA